MAIAVVLAMDVECNNASPLDSVGRNVANNVFQNLMRPRRDKTLDSNEVEYTGSSDAEEYKSSHTPAGRSNSGRLGRRGTGRSTDDEEGCSGH